MKILITADLHYREQWFRLLSRAPEWDLLCIAGDLLDMFSAEPRIVQARTVSGWIRELAKVTRVAICSGNHDNTGPQITADRAPVYEWLYELGKEPGTITDGSTEVFDDLIVTTVPYDCSREQKSVWLDRGASIRRQRGSPWLVLHHVPPIAYPGSFLREEREAKELLLTYRPEYFVSGHSHEFPYFPGSSWRQIVNGVNVLVPGQILSAPFPNHIILNTLLKEASWETSSQRWISEGEAYDQLVVKFPRE
jgi:predicted MPP superfamily phosphohydrolase